MIVNFVYRIIYRRQLLSEMKALRKDFTKGYNTIIRPEKIIKDKNAIDFAAAFGFEKKIIELYQRGIINRDCYIEQYNIVNKELNLHGFGHLEDFPKINLYLFGVWQSKLMKKDFEDFNALIKEFCDIHREASNLRWKK